MAEREDRSVKIRIPLPAFLLPRPPMNIPTPVQHPQADPHRTLEPVHFEYRATRGSHVAIAGSFNGWEPSAAPMHAVGPGRWRAKVLLPHGRHEYRLVVDGVWMTDPTASLTVANPYGGFNSVIDVPTGHAAANADATPRPTESLAPGRYDATTVASSSAPHSATGRGR